ncbi:uncharacterized protein LOC144860772 [Branchiostoma floridae x Branchiostoma japonicum]
MGGPDMRTMGWALLFLLAAIASTAAEDFDIDGEDQLFDQEEDIDADVAAELLDDIEDLNEELRRGFSGHGHGHGRGGFSGGGHGFSGGGHGHGHGRGGFSGGGHGFSGGGHGHGHGGGGGLFGHGGFLGTGLGAGHGQGGSVQSAAQGARGNTVYHVFAQAKNYDQAKQHCQSINGHLADIKTRALHDFILGLIRKVDFNRDYWFGLNERTVAKTWTWSDGSPIKGCDFTYWAPGEPNNALWSQDCGQLWKQAGYKWDDDNCAHQKYFICQIGPGEGNACGGSSGGFSAGGLSGGGFSGSGLGGGAATWLRRDPSWVVSSAGTPWKNGGVTYDAAKALDGSTGTYWNPQETSRNYNNWYIVLDLKAPYTLSQIAINNFGDTTHDVKAFKLQKSQSGAQNSWEDVTSVGTVQGGTNRRQEFGGFQGTARYWRFVVTQTHSGYQPYLVGVDFYGSRAGKRNIC